MSHGKTFTVAKPNNAVVLERTSRHGFSRSWSLGLEAGGPSEPAI